MNQYIILGVLSQAYLAPRILAAFYLPSMTLTPSFTDATLFLLDSDW